MVWRDFQKLWDHGTSAEVSTVAAIRLLKRTLQLPLLKQPLKRLGRHVFWLEASSSSWTCKVAKIMASTLNSWLVLICTYLICLYPKMMPFIPRIQGRRALFFCIWEVLLGFGAPGEDQEFLAASIVTNIMVPSSQQNQIRQTHPNYLGLRSSTPMTSRDFHVRFQKLGTPIKTPKLFKDVHKKDPPHLQKTAMLRPPLSAKIAYLKQADNVSLGPEGPHKHKDLTFWIPGPKEEGYQKPCAAGSLCLCGRLGPRSLKPDPEMPLDYWCARLAVVLFCTLYGPGSPEYSPSSYACPLHCRVDPERPV